MKRGETSRVDVRSCILISRPHTRVQVYHLIKKAASNAVLVGVDIVVASWIETRFYHSWIFQYPMKRIDNHKYSDIVWIKLFESNCLNRSEYLVSQRLSRPYPHTYFQSIVCIICILYLKFKLRDYRHLRAVRSSTTHLILSAISKRSLY